MKRLSNDIILAFLVALIVASPLIAQTRRTVAEARADHNAVVCEAARQAKGCTQAQVDAAVAAVPTIGALPGTIYATDAAFRDGELLPVILEAKTRERNNRASEALNRAFQSLTPAKRVAVCAAAELHDPEVCR